ncbi:3'-5' exonuclease [Massilia sp. erpn]|uniref:3'-5' exonuclease n=1 Tax=Massilia sp. erpn TaxID=2738142 RepID=UPI0021069F26|nr:ATP-dependent helicase [Massilia sp. erpn]UTY57741.1 ATP-dependent helicase [Massilia sp. erpn]
MPLAPTPEQQLILQSDAPVLMVEAVAGAGKTTTLAMLAAQARGEVLGLCFSAGAKLRFQQKLHEECPGRQVSVMTMEEFARALLSRLAHDGLVDKAQFCPSEEALRPQVVAAAEAVWQRYEERRCDFDFSFRDNSARVDAMLALLATLKATTVAHRFQEDLEQDDIEQIAERFDVPPQAVEICQAYERMRQLEPGVYLWQGLADLVPDVLSLLSLHPPALDSIRQVQLCLVDEWHDVNAAEFELLQIFRRQARLVVVGDRSQVINTARGADIHFSHLGFELGFPGAQRLELSRSHRFGISVAKLAARASGRKCQPMADTYSSVGRHEYDAADAGCAPAVAQQVARLVQAGGKLSDIAIIVREADQTIAIENALLDANQPYACDGVESYLLRPEILMLRGLLHVACGDYATLRGDKDVCARMAAALYQFLSIDSASEVWDSSHEMYGSGSSLAARAQEDVAQDPAMLAWLVGDALCAEAASDGGAARRWKQRLRQVVDEMRQRAPQQDAAALLQFASQTLDLPAAASRAVVNRRQADSALRAIQAFVAFARQHGGMDGAAFLQELHKRQKRVGSQGFSGRRKQLTLTTVAAAKGREWPCVMVPLIEQGQFPRGRDTEEEKRYFYVAITRAMQALLLFEPDERNAAARSYLMAGFRKPEAGADKDA